MSALITCKDLALGYETGVAVQGLSFAVHAGDYLCVVGENGSGKSTLIKGLLGLLQPLGGEIRFAGGVTRRQIGYLPQQTPLQKDFPASVLEVVLSGCLGQRGLLPFYSPLDKARAKANMRLLGIDSLTRASYRNLSGGQRQRVLLARALCSAGKLLLLDEPVTGLDPHASDEMYDILEQLNKKQGVTIIMVSHDVAHALRCATQVLHLDETGEVFFGSVAVYRKSALGRLYLRHSQGEGGV
ncbi:MAG: metal ABC transporter ATP-binding protein [Christensenellaceae bacterium]|jgi:zinc transport system ATP-binding protein|nr:metal ABC transporter ATP-binding protein [Christensenellaceae bacterium]